MTATILDKVPISGQHLEFSFGEKFNHTLWVEFESAEGGSWYGCFSKTGHQGYDKVIVDNLGQTALIIADGHAYVIDAINRKLIFQSEEYPPIQTAIKTNNPEYYLLSSYSEISVIDTNGNVKKINPHFGTDGIFFTSQEGNIALGYAETYENQYERPYDFELDLTTFEIRVINIRQKGFWENLFG